VGVDSGRAAAATVEATAVVVARTRRDQ